MTKLPKQKVILGNKSELQSSVTNDGSEINSPTDQIQIPATT